jgi:large subunit ribosomal protein L6
LDEQTLKVEGPKGKLEQNIPAGITVKVEGSEAKVVRPNDERQSKAYHGLVRSLLANMVAGVTTGFEKELHIEGVGYRAAVAGKVVLSVLILRPG